MFSAGDKVKVLPPFAAALPDIYTVAEAKPDGETYTLDTGADFNETYLEVATW